MVLRRNNSQKAGCMRLSPASHCCHVRHVVCKSSAAAVCESPATSRAARTSSGVGFRAGLQARLRLGWLLIEFGGGLVNHQVGADRRMAGIKLPLHGTVGAVISGLIAREEAGFSAVPQALVDRAGGCERVFVARLAVGHDGAGDVGGESGHFDLQPLSPEARLWRIHTMNNTRIARNVKGFRKINFRGRIKPSNMKVRRGPAAEGETEVTKEQKSQDANEATIGAVALDRRVSHLCENPWLEAAVAWEVCASIHERYAKGKDAMYSTRRKDFLKHAEDARKMANVEVSGDEQGA